MHGVLEMAPVNLSEARENLQAQQDGEAEGVMLENAANGLDERLARALGIDDSFPASHKDIFPLATGPEAEANTKKFLYAVVNILLDFINRTNDRSSHVLKFHHPEDIPKHMDFTLPETPHNLSQILIDCQTALRWQVRTGHPHFFNQLTQGLDIISMAGEWLTATANANMFTYEIAPVFLTMEKEVLQKMRKIIGWESGDSILAPGGAISNMYAILIARHKMFPQHKNGGMRAIHAQLICYTSSHAHFSVRSAAATLGLGIDNCREVDVDENMRMEPAKLELMIQEDLARGCLPFFVSCTSGTTVIGAFDPIQPLADICTKYKLWLHVDAAWGGGLLMSRTHRVGRFRAIDRADSLTWNPHKLLGVLLQCSTFHTRYEGLLHDCNAMRAEYLFQQDKHYDVSHDTGDKVIQCGRHNDIFKFWITWRSKGTQGFEEQVDRLMDLAQYQMRKMKEKPDVFKFVFDKPEFVNICFWYIPKRLRNKPLNTNIKTELGKITAVLKSRMMNTGNLMVSYQPLDKTPNFFRSILSNPACREEDVDFMLEEMDRLGNDL